MLESSTSVCSETPSWDAGGLPAPGGRRQVADAASLLRCMLEHVDYGMALMSIATRRLRLANAPALLAMSGDSGHSSGLTVIDGMVCAVLPQDERALERSLTLARTGVRDLLNLGPAKPHNAVAVVPLSGVDDDGHVLLMFAKRRVCDASALALFARSHDLTAAESNVLGGVCEGMRPHEVAEQHGVQVSTVRSQLLSIRQKTRSASIRDLVQTISLLPPMARHLN